MWQMYPDRDRASSLYIRDDGWERVALRRQDSVGQRVDCSVHILALPLPGSPRPASVDSSVKWACTVPASRLLWGLSE